MRHFAKWSECGTVPSDECALIFLSDVLTNSVACNSGPWLDFRELGKKPGSFLSSIRKCIRLKNMCNWWGYQHAIRQEESNSAAWSRASGRTRSAQKRAGHREASTDALAWQMCSDRAEMGFIDREWDNRHRIYPEISRVKIIWYGNRISMILVRVTSYYQSEDTEHYIEYRRFPRRCTIKIVSIYHSEQNYFLFQSVLFLWVVSCFKSCPFNCTLFLQWPINIWLAQLVDLWSEHISFSCRETFWEFIRSRL
jgi:hypothetical protein